MDHYKNLQRNQRLKSTYLCEGDRKIAYKGLRYKISGRSDATRNRQRATINETIAQEQFNELAPLAVRYVASFVKFYFDTINPPEPTGTIEVKRVDGAGAALSNSIPTTAAIDTGVEKTDNPALFTNLLVSGNPYTVGATDRPEYVEKVATCSTSGCTLLPGDVTYVPADCDGIFCNIDVNVLDGGLTRVVFLYDECAVGFEKSGDVCVPATSTTFATDDRVQVNAGTGSNLNVRSTPNDSVVGQQPNSMLGTVIGGPVFAGGIWWWQVNFDSGADGWVAEDFLRAPLSPPIQLAYASFSVFNRAVPKMATGLAVGGVVSVFNRTVTGTVAVGERVTTTDNLNVRNAPGLSSTILGVQADNSLGTVVGGSVFVDGHLWWQVDFDSGADGWVAGDFLAVPPLPPIQLAYASFSVFNTAAPASATSLAEGEIVSVFNRTTPTTHMAGGRVHVDTGDGSNLNVRSAPRLSGAVLGVQADGAQGTVVGGPIPANGFQWWQVNFDSGADGWVAGDFLEPPPQNVQDAHTTLAVFNSAAPDAIDGHVEGPVFSIDNLP